MPCYTRRPEWLKLQPLNSTVLSNIRRVTHDLKLHTVCDSARCPNRPECFAQGTVTFMLLGDICTRNCTFCSVKKSKPLSPDPEEPERIAAAVDKLKLRYVVITSVTRDDLPDGGASQFAQTLRAIHEYDPYVMVEVLIPDFNGSLSALQKVTDTFPAVLNHNVETVSSLYPEVRPEADYRRSIRLLEQSKLLNNEILTKSGFMLGLGEVRQEVIKLMINLREVGCDLLTIGQYLQPSLKHHKITDYIPPEEFEEYVDIGRQLGFRQVTSGPLVRSSFHAAEAYLLAME